VPHVRALDAAPPAATRRRPLPRPPGQRRGSGDGDGVEGRGSVTVTDAHGTVRFYAPQAWEAPRPSALALAVTRVVRNPQFNYTPSCSGTLTPRTPGHDSAGSEQPCRHRVGRPDAQALWCPRHTRTGSVGHTQTHGCVRLTNWDVLKVC